jgi:hypothetical protein
LAAYDFYEAYAATIGNSISAARCIFPLMNLGNFSKKRNFVRHLQIRQPPPRVFLLVRLR